MNPGYFAAAAWIVFASVLSLAGWGLSLADQLDARGYFGVIAFTLVVGAIVGRRCSDSLGSRRWWTRTGRRLRRPLPLAWLCLWLLAVVGGAIHAPNNIDALTYRLPRMLHWLAEGRWHWLASPDARMDYSAPGFEWLTLPPLALGLGDRTLFLANAIPFLLLPGLLFSFFRWGGVARRVAWKWMWLLPLGHVYLLQGGSIANDALGAVYFLVACGFIAKGADQNRSGPWVLAVLALGLMTGLKTSNLPLVLPVVCIALIARRGQGLPPLVWTGAAVALLISAAPVMVLNSLHTGSLWGDPMNVSGLRVESPGAGLLGNSIEFTVQNLAPPAFPWADGWNEWSAQRLEPRIRAALGYDFPRFSLRLGELAQEEWAGLGLLAWVMLIGGAFVSSPTRRAGFRRGFWIGLTGWGAALVFAAGIGSEMPARLLAPYYPVLCLPFLCMSGQAAWCRMRAWRVLAGFVVLTAAGLLLVNPARPILPMPWLTDAWSTKWSDTSFARRAADVYETYANRHDPLKALRKQLPAEVTRVGFLGSADDSEISFWRPYGGREVVRLQESDDPIHARARGVRWLVVRADLFWGARADEDGWLNRWNAEVIARQTGLLKASQPSEDWALVQLKEPPTQER